jgi:hypothetical protein
MPLLVICSRLQCDFVLALQDRERGESTPTPLFCPVCDSEVITFCPGCGFPILSSVEQRQITCKVCRSDLRRTFADDTEGEMRSVN